MSIWVVTIFFKIDNKIVDIRLKDLYDLETFELWYLNNFKNTLKITDINSITHYLNKNEIYHVVSGNGHWNSQKHVFEEDYTQ